MAWLPKRKPQFLHPGRAQAILERYRTRRSKPLSYATVEDYCDSVDHLPEITGLRGDLKDVQRPWAAKSLIGLLPQGSTLLEFGAGCPEVAALLAECGYRVIVVDPYEGAGGGPVAYDAYKTQFPQVEIHRSLFTEDFAFDEQVDAIYSISTLEHIADLDAIFRAIRKFLKPGGISLHCVDVVTRGDMTDYHLNAARQVLKLQNEPAGAWDELLEKAESDLETYLLGPSGHQYWRGATPYEQFRYRKVMSLETWARF